MINAGPLIVIGDHAYFRCTLYLNGAASPDLTGATVTAAIVTNERTAILAGPITLVSGTDGSDWENRVVITTFGPTDTAGLSPGRARVEIQTVEAGIKQTWSESVRIVRGLLP